MQSTGHVIVGGLCACLSNNVLRVTFICADKSASALKAFDFDLMRSDHALHRGGKHPSQNATLWKQTEWVLS